MLIEFATSLISILVGSTGIAYLCEVYKLSTSSIIYHSEAFQRGIGKG